MFKKITNWFNGSSDVTVQRLEAIEAQMKHDAKERERLAEQLVEAEEQLEMYRSKEASDDAIRSSTEPWVEVKSTKLDPIKGIQIELDWNDAFVQYLKDNGLQGRDDDTIVQKWLAMLYENLINGLETQSIDNSDKTRVSDFV